MRPATKPCAFAREGLTFLHPFDDNQVINGQGTIGLELLEQVAQLEAVVVPIGGGGLISGVACALKESNPANPRRRVYKQSVFLPCCALSSRAARLLWRPRRPLRMASQSDAPAILPFPLVERYVDEIVTVDEEEIANAIMVLLEREKTLAEGAGAVALAALLQKKTFAAKARTHRCPGLRGKHRCKSAGADYRTRSGEGRTQRSHSRPSG